MMSITKSHQMLSHLRDIAIIGLEALQNMLAI